MPKDKTTKTKTLLLIGLATLLAPATQASQQLLARSIRDARAEAGRTDAQLKATLGAIPTLTKQTEGDLRPAYNAYRTHLK